MRNVQLPLNARERQLVKTYWFYMKFLLELLLRQIIFFLCKQCLVSFHLNGQNGFSVKHRTSLVK